MAGPRRRIRASSATGGGGTPITGTLEVGPSFGQSAGDDPSTLGASTAVVLAPYGLIYGTTVQGNLDLTNLRLANQQLNVQASLDFAASILYNKLFGRAAVDLESLRLAGNLTASANVKGSVATSRNLTAASAVDLASVNGRADLDLTVNLDAHAAITPVGTDASNDVLTDLNLSSIAPQSIRLTSQPAVFLSEMELIDYLDWADANVTTTGFTNPGNAIDKDTNTFASCTAAATGIGGVTPNTTNGTLVSSFPDFASPFTNFTLTSVILEYRWGTVTAGTQVSAGSVSMQGAYSLDDGGSFTNTELVTGSTTVSSGNPVTVDITTPVGGDWTKITQFRHRWTGTVASGTGLNKSMEFRAHYYRLRIQAQRTF